MKIIKDNNNVLMVLNEVNNVDNLVIKSNSVDASFEKHVPIVSKIDDFLVEIKVDHVMEEDHYIEWIMVEYNDSQFIKYFKPGDNAIIRVPSNGIVKVYSYCNKHSLWVNDSIDL